MDTHVPSSVQLPMSTPPFRGLEGVFDPCSTHDIFLTPWCFYPRHIDPKHTTHSWWCMDAHVPSPVQLSMSTPPFRGLEGVLDHSSTHEMCVPPWCLHPRHIDPNHTTHSWWCMDAHVPSPVQLSMSTPPFRGLEGVLDHCSIHAMCVPPRCFYPRHIDPEHTTYSWWCMDAHVPSPVPLPMSTSPFWGL